MIVCFQNRSRLKPNILNPGDHNCKRDHLTQVYAKNTTGICITNREIKYLSPQVS